MVKKEKVKKRNISGIEWTAIFLVFLIAMITGYFYTMNRLESSAPDLVDQVTSPDPPGMEGWE